MPLYEVTWTHNPSVLVSASSTGKALHWLQEAFGPQCLFDIQDLLPIEEESFLLVHRDGWIDHEQYPPSLRFCANQSPRCFLVHHHEEPSRKAAFVVDHISTLPSLILWHFEVLDEASVVEESRVLGAWERYHSQFQLLELDTESEGILLLFEDHTHLIDEDADTPSRLDR